VGIGVEIDQIRKVKARRDRGAKDDQILNERGTVVRGI
jgi:hypothetical protein